MTRTPLSRLKTALAALAGIAAVVLLSASPALAHDELVATDPGADSSVEGVPAEITLTFSGDVLPDAGATVIEVTDETGADLTAGDPVVEGADVTQALAGEASGAVTVLWRVASSDGHPISGEYSFTVAPAPTPTASPTPSESATTDDSATPTPTATPSPAAAPANDDDSSVTAWIIVGVLVLVAVAATVVVIVSRRTARTRER